MSDEPFPPVDTARFRLRCVAPRDAAATSAMMTPEVSRWVATWPVPFTPEMAAARIAAARAGAAGREALSFAVVGRTDDTLRGWVMLGRDRGDRRRGHFGYWLGVSHHGQGTLREVGPAALACGFALLDLDVIEAAAQLANAASFAVMRACGMHAVGERTMHAPARDRDERCGIYEIARAAIA